MTNETAINDTLIVYGVMELGAGFLGGGSRLWMKGIQFKNQNQSGLPESMFLKARWNKLRSTKKKFF